MHTKKTENPIDVHVNALVENYTCGIEDHMNSGKRNLWTEITLVHGRQTN